ncbi:hypothetical protein D3C78_1646770 [compost metagenome]
MKREDSSLMRVSTTLRAVMSDGALTTAENALSMSLTDAPRPLSPPANTSCSLTNEDARARSAAWTAPAVVAWRLSRSL